MVQLRFQAGNVLQRGVQLALDALRLLDRAQPLDAYLLLGSGETVEFYDTKSRDEYSMYSFHFGFGVGGRNYLPISAVPSVSTEAHRRISSKHARTESFSVSIVNVCLPDDIQANVIKVHEKGGRSLPVFQKSV